MHSVPGYTLAEILVENAHTRIGRGRRGEQPVLIRVPTRDSPTAADLARLRYDYAVARELDLPSVLKPCALEEGGGTLRVVLEDFPGGTLRSLLAAGEIELSDALALAIELSTALGEIHRRRIVHKSIDPSNILVHRETMRVKWTHFDIASRLPREQPARASPSRLEGSLAAMAPEQTGHTNRGVDYRADFYSLGVILYELFTGRLPFRATDPRALVHNHLTVMPEPPERVRPTIARPVSQVVMKLLAKDPEDRYQSADGLTADLAECLEQVKTVLNPREFIPGIQDIPEAVHVPEKLWDREREKAALAEAFARAGQGSAELVLVSGGSGTGKSALVHEIYASVVQQRGYYASGRFDELDRSPYSALAQALEELIDEVMQQSAEEMATLKDRLLSSLGCHCRTILELFPGTAPLFEAEALRDRIDWPVEESGLHLALQRFIAVFARPEHPLVLFLDDLQWADSATIKLLRPLLQHPDTGYLLLICAFRDGDAGEAHPLCSALRNLRQARPTSLELGLLPLSPSAARAWVAGALCTDEPSAAPVSHVVHDSSRGNPFLFGRTLAELARRELFVVAPHSGAWTWDVKQIEERLAEGGANHLLRGMLWRLSAHTRHLLLFAAGLGHRFDLKTLAIVAQKSPDDAARDLWEALREGLVVPIGGNYRFAGSGMEAPSAAPAPARDLEISYRFAHHEIHRAVRELFDEENRCALSLEMGRRLRAAHGGRAPGGKHLFLIPALLNQAAARIEEPFERRELARWNLAAGRKARLGCAFDEAILFFDAGLSLLSGPAAWDEEYDLAFALAAEAAECEYARGRPERAGSLCRMLLSRARSNVERARIHDLAIVHHTAAGRYDDALAGARTALALLGIDGLFDGGRCKADVDAALAEVEKHLDGRSIPALIDAAPMTDPMHVGALQILIHACEAASRTSPALLYVLCVARQVSLSLQHGRSALSAYGYTAYGGILAVRFGKPREGFLFGKLGIDLNDRSGDVRSKGRLNAMFGWFSHFAKPFRWTLPYLEQGAQAGMESGDLRCVAAIAPLILATKAHLGEDLRHLHTEAGRLLALAHRTGDALATAFLMAGKQRIENLTGRTQEQGTLSDDSFDDAAYAATLQAPELALAAGYYYTVKLELAFLYGDHASALAMAGEAQKRAASCAGHSFTTDTILFTCLTLAALLPTAPPAKREEYLNTIRRHSAELTGWADGCPANYRHKDLLVKAELANLSGDTLRALGLYDQAIQAAAENDFTHHEALGNELCAQAYLLEGMDKPARAYMLDALECYRHWGATAKVADLKTRYPQLIFQIISPGHASDQPGSGPPTARRASVRPSSGALHASSILSATRAIASEILLQDLLPKLLTILLEHSGAPRGVLWLPGDHPLVVEADLAKGLAPAIVTAAAFETRADLPHGILRVVERTVEAIVFADAAAAGIFQSDRYISRHRPRSILCMPIVQEDKLAGILYLENSAIKNAFTPDRCEALEHLCAQAGISIGNARRYEALDSLVSERNRELSETALRLKETQQRLFMQEKRASLGSIASGIAHEIKNPLNFVTNFAELSVSVAMDLSSEIEEQKFLIDPKSLALIQEMIGDLQQNSEKIKEHGRRADHIVKAMLDYSRTGSEGEKRSYDIHTLLHEYVTLAYQGIRAQNPSFHVHIETSYPQALPHVHIVPQDIGRVILNLVQNACYALEARKREAGQGFVPTIKVSTRDLGREIELRVRDNGGGIPEAVRAKIFQAFFTTKPPGEGTGLGLSISHEIVVEGHGGTLRFETEEGQFTEFIVTLPHTPDSPQHAS